MLKIKYYLEIIILIIILSFAFSSNAYEEINYDCESTKSTKKVEGFIIDLDYKNELVNSLIYYNEEPNEFEKYLESKNWSFDLSLEPQIEFFEYGFISINIFFNIDKYLNSFKEFIIPNNFIENYENQKKWIKRDFEKLPKSVSPNKRKMFNLIISKSNNKGYLKSFIGEFHILNCNKIENE